MAKTLIILVLIAGAAYFIYQQVGKAPTAEEQLVTHLRERYNVVINKFVSAAGRSGALGIETLSDTDTAVNDLQKLRSDLAELRQRLTEGKAIRKAEELSEKIENFCKKNDIIRP
jgi:cell shape-determining protein MreC